MKSSRTLFVILVLVTGIKKSKNLCENVKREVICLSVNNISSATLSQLPEIDEVKEISILYNPRLEVASTSFESVVELERVIINHNGILRIHSGTFKNLPLKYINLEFNGISYIDPGTFCNLPNLKKMYLGNNALKHIPKGVFANLPLQELSLSKNNISSIEYMAFENLEDLKKLKLDNNELHSICLHEILTYPGRLKLLWLNNNYLTNVTGYMLQRLDKLKTLNLGHNSISLIEPNAFEGTPKLIRLILSSNSLKEIHSYIFPRSGLTLLDTLYIDNNKLMYLSTSFLDALGSLKKITLVGNPWYCTCLTQVQKILQEKNILEICNEDYTSGTRAICIGNMDAASECQYTYNDKFCERYEKDKKDQPLYSSTLLCLGVND